MNTYIKTIASIVLTLTMANAALAVSPPVISPATGVYSQIEDTVTITAGMGDTIHVTTDGTPATSASPVYSGPITIGEKAVIRAIARNGGIDSAESISNILNDPLSHPVARTDLQLWLRSDFGPEVSGANVIQWNDLSGAASPNNAVQGTSADQPILIDSAINGKPAVSFDGISQFLALSSGISDLTAGASIFAVVKPIGSVSATLFTMGNNPDDSVSLLTLTDQVELDAYNSTTSSSVVSASSSLAQDLFQAVDAVHDGAGSADINLDALNIGSGSVQNLTNTSRTFNFIGTDAPVTTFFQGQLAELLVYSRPVTSVERADIQAYLINKFQLSTAQNIPAPIFSMAGGTVFGPVRIAISARPDCDVFYTLDGTTPSSGSTLYSGPINISFTQNLQAIAISQDGISSSVTSETYTLNATDFPAPDPLDTSPLQIELQLPTTSQ
ncbi:MAG: chitobiase/beta-hexosaminidase C-terminal domain-containing protein [Candidatus Melainabacteria bacterium]|nr:chitobiase/beta-hexosaminidase C-terminal domain-containing protein [Candidatus Melainabacteria bacterium]